MQAYHSLWCGKMREAEGWHSFLQQLALAPLCCGHSTLLEWLVGSLRRDIWRLNVAFKAWRWQGTQQTGPILVYTQGQPQGYIWKQVLFIYSSQTQSIYGELLYCLCPGIIPGWGGKLSICPSVEKNYISKRQELQTHQEVDISTQDFCFMRTIFFRPMHLKSSPGHWHGDLCSLEDWL